MNLAWAASRRLGLAVTAIVIAAGSAAQQPAPAPSQPSQPPVATQPSAYRPPAIALVQPAAGGSVPNDRPVVVFRFGQGEHNDALDTRSFAVTVDGIDRTSLFQVTASEAWGPIAAPSDHLEAGSHQIAARICSSRGACGETSGVVTVVSAGALSDPARSDDKRGKGRVIRALLSALRQLLSP